MVSANSGASDMNNARVKPIPLGHDNLQFKHDIAIMQQLDQNEHIVYSLQVVKYNRFGMK